MSGIDAVLYEYMLFIRIFSVFRLQPLCAFMSTYANSWIKSAARQNIIWIRFGNRRVVRPWQTGAEMALTAIGEVSQWGVVGCSGSRTLRHSGIWGAADEAVLNKVHIKESKNAGVTVPHLTRPEGDRSLDPMYPVLPRFSYIIFVVYL